MDNYGGIGTVEAILKEMETNEERMVAIKDTTINVIKVIMKANRISILSEYDKTRRNRKGNVLVSVALSSHRDQQNVGTADEHRSNFNYAHTC
jgi:hypothetical protein